MSRPGALLVLLTGVTLSVCSCEPEIPILPSSGQGNVRELINQTEYVLAGTLALSDRKALIAKVQNRRVLRGAQPPANLRLTFGSCDQVKLLRRHVVDGAPILFFPSEQGVSYIYLNRVFVPFYLTGPPGDWQAGIFEGQWNHIYNGSVSE